MSDAAQQLLKLTLEIVEDDNGYCEQTRLSEIVAREVLSLRTINAELVAALGGLILHAEELNQYGREPTEMKIARKAYQAAAKGEQT